MSVSQEYRSEGLSIVIPLFNESENVEELFFKISEFFELANFNFEIILVDGCSSDDTYENILIQSKKLNMPQLKLLKMQTREGYGYDIIEGLKITTFKNLAWTHADLQADLNDLIKGYEVFQQTGNNIIVKGARKNRPLLDQFLTFGMQLFAYSQLKIYLSDINAQPKIFDVNFFDNYVSTNYPNDFSLDLFLLLQAKKNNYTIHTFDVDFKKRKFGEAKGGGGSIKNRITLIKRTFKYIIDLRNAAY
jgi:polyisoprenyl-phosphate glycosyltransferase